VIVTVENFYLFFLVIRLSPVAVITIGLIIFFKYQLYNRVTQVVGHRYCCAGLARFLGKKRKFRREKWVEREVLNGRRHQLQPRVRRHQVMHLQIVRPDRKLAL
jgi:hypothetical protein